MVLTSLYLNSWLLTYSCSYLFLTLPSFSRILWILPPLLLLSNIHLPPLQYGQQGRRHPRNRGHAGARAQDCCEEGASVQAETRPVQPWRWRRAFPLHPWQGESSPCMLSGCSSTQAAGEELRCWFMFINPSVLLFVRSFIYCVGQCYVKVGFYPQATCVQNS